MIIVPGKRGTSAARGYKRKMICSFFLLVWHRLGRSSSASVASQTQVPSGRHDNSPGQARNERRPGLQAQNVLFFFLLVWRASAAPNQEETKAGGVAFIWSGALAHPLRASAGL